MIKTLKLNYGEFLQVLYEISKYLKGLDNIAFEDNMARDDMYCTKPVYGHFLVVINKMMGTASDQQLAQELMTPEPNHNDGSQERNEIRKKLTQCFNGVSVHGLPILSLQPGQEIDYDILTPRFQVGLAKIANTTISKSVEPRLVTVGGISRELNSTTAEVLIGTVIDEANKGQVSKNDIHDNSI